jgi:hypothetical protein
VEEIQRLNQFRQTLLKLHPEMLEQFPQNKAGTRRFQIYTDD